MTFKEEISYILRHQCSSIDFVEKDDHLIVNLDCRAICGYAIADLDYYARQNNLRGPVVTIQSIEDPKIQIIL